MMKTQLLDLPNELFLFIFQYLKSSDLIEIFLPIESIRIQSLIQISISKVDISEKTKQWIEIYLSDLFFQQIIQTLRLQDKHVNLISNYFLTSNIQSMHILSSDWTTDILKEGIDYIRKYLKDLSITFTYPHGKGDIANYLFQSDTQLEYLNVNGRFLYFDNHDIKKCDSLKYLSIELEGVHRVFILVQNLPKLEELKVKFRSEDRMIQQLSTNEQITCNNTLRRVTFTGCTKYFEHLERFFTIFGSKIESLSMNIDLMYYLIDGKRFEQEILIKMPDLLTLDLIIHSSATYCNPIEIETFQSLIWEKFNPIVYCHDIHAHEHTIFTLPYKSDRFKHLSNDCISSCKTNRPVSLCFDRVKTLSLIPTTTFNFETFRFIEKVFRNIQTLELKPPMKFPELENNIEHNRIISYMNKDILLNLNLQLPSITKLCFLLPSQSDDYRIFRSFLYLLPNLIYLQMFIGRILYREILSHENEDLSLRNSLNRIKLLQMVRFYDEKNVLSNDEIHCLFPNAQILFDYDEV